MANIDIKLKSYDELLFEITKLNTDKYLLQYRIDKAIEYIKENVDNTGWLEIGSSCVKELLKILGDKECTLNNIEK